jgi:hypothetical protein
MLGGHAVGGVADQYHRAAAPACSGDLLDRGDVHPVRVVELPQQLWDRGGEAGEPLAQVPDRIAVQVVAGEAVGGDVGVAVDQALAERDGQEGGALAEHDRPGDDLGRAGGQEPPAVLADRDRRPWVDGQPPDRGAQPIGPDDQVELATAAVVEADLDGPVDVLQRPDGAAQLHRTPSRRIWCSSVRGKARQGPTPSHS